MELAAVGDLVGRARAGDRAAWEQIVAGHIGTVHALCRGWRLGEDEAAAVNQVVWLRLAEHLDRLRAPAAVAGWIAATARDECQRVLRARGEAAGPGGGATGAAPVDDGAGVDAPLAVYARDRALLGAFAALDNGCRRTLWLVAADPRPGEAEVAAALDVPARSVGQAVARCVERLRERLDRPCTPGGNPVAPAGP
ncbi:MAG TPA: sigma-70 family RNA polymerase sigma factor [Acidimicrobiales bacterium]